MSDTGHAKNVANFAQLVTIVSNLGEAYQPSNPLIKLSHMQIKLKAAQTASEAVTPKESAETLAVSARQTAFEPLGKLVTRIGNAADVSVNDESFSDDLRSVTRKLQGRRASAKIKDDPNTPEDESKQSGSSSQMSYDNQVGFFAELIDLLKSNTAYNPNETPLQTASLEAMLADLQAKTNAVITTSVAAKTARIARDEVLYNTTNGIKELADLVKKYVKSVFGSDSPQYKQLTALQLRRPTK